jgi:hypothetical protein
VYCSERETRQQRERERGGTGGERQWKDGGETEGRDKKANNELERHGGEI